LWIPTLYFSFEVYLLVRSLDLECLVVAATYIPFLSLKVWGNSSIKILIALSYFGTALVTTSSTHTTWLTRTLNFTESYLAKHSGIIAEKTNMTLSLKIGKCISKHPILKKKNFLEFNNNDDKPINLTYTKGELLYSLNTLVISIPYNYAPTNKYRQRFFHNEPVICSCNHTLLKTCDHILYNYKHYYCNNY